MCLAKGRTRREERRRPPYNATYMYLASRAIPNAHFNRPSMARPTAQYYSSTAVTALLSTEHPHPLAPPPPRTRDPSPPVRPRQASLSGSRLARQRLSSGSPPDGSSPAPSPWLFRAPAARFALLRPDPHAPLPAPPWALLRPPSTSSRSVAHGRSLALPWAGFLLEQQNEHAGRRRRRRSAAPRAHVHDCFGQFSSKFLLQPPIRRPRQSGLSTFAGQAPFPSGFNSTTHSQQRPDLPPGSNDSRRQWARPDFRIIRPFTLSRLDFRCRLIARLFPSRLLESAPSWYPPPPTACRVPL